jgi:molybdopterin-binding protein
VQISIRNKLLGTIKEIKLGKVMAEVVIVTGSQEIVSVITKDAAEEMGLNVGDTVTALIKSTSVMLQKQ